MQSNSGILARLFFFLIKPAVIATGFVIFLYGIIFWSVNRGVSIDEGYYLLGYLQDQPIKYALTDFHYIVKSLFFFLPEDNALLLRIIRVVFTLLALYFFTNSSYKWLCKEFSLKTNKLTFFSLSFLVGTLCFAYASPVLYYDNMQMIIYLVSFAFLFEILLDHRPFIKLLFSFLLGFSFIFALTNYLPAGVFLIFTVIFIIAIYIKPFISKAFQILLAILGGVVGGLIIYNFCIHNIRDVAAGIMSIYTSASEFEVTKYETGGQLTILLQYLSDLIITLLPVLIGSTLYYFLRKKLKKHSKLLDILFLIITTYLVYRLSFYYSNIILLPIMVVTIDFLVGNKFRVKEKIRGKNLILICILLAVPLLGVLGSNQLLARKMFFYMPFWFLALYILMAELKVIKNKFLADKYHILLILTVSIVFFFQGFIRHPHYNYSIRKSKYTIENAVRFKGIKVSEYQQNFYENGIRSLKVNGFEPGDNILAFYETYMLVYAAGGYVPDGLTYWAYQFASDPDNIPSEKVNFIIIDESEIEVITDFLSCTDWDFPASYKRSDLGTDGHNLTQLGFNYLLFSKYP